MVNLVAVLVNSGSGLTSLSGNVKNQEIIISGTGSTMPKDLQSNSYCRNIWDWTGYTERYKPAKYHINGSGQVSYIRKSEYSAACNRKWNS